MRRVSTNSKVEEIEKFASSRDLNEADTRHRIIDAILHEVLMWPRNRVTVEEYIDSGYVDYVLKKNDGSDLLFIEAKKSGLYFNVPDHNGKNQQYSYVPISRLISDANIDLAMRQVRKYCLDTGCEYACVTNGNEWIFFKIFEKGMKWERLNALVLRTVSAFRTDYTLIFNSLCFAAINYRSSLIALLSSAPPKDRAIFFPKERVTSYSHVINANRLANGLRATINRYFGVIKDDDTEFMERCYVSQREYQGTSDEMHSLIQDSLTPFFESFGVKQLDDTGKGGRLGGRLTKNLKAKKPGEVLVLFGGKGSGKSTFIKRLLRHNEPRWIRDHAAIAIIDLLKVPEDTDVIRREIWDGLVKQLDVDNLLDGDRDLVLKQLFADRFELAKRQDLAGISKTSNAYNIELNKLFVEWKQDKKYCAVQLVAKLAIQSKGAIVVIDNTDQYSAPIQDFCFASAQEISNTLGCTCLISMREERFFDSKIHGILDAFQNSGFHISSPRPAEVFRKRLNYVVMLLESGRAIVPDDDDDAELVVQLASDGAKYLGILSREFSNDNSPLNRFLSACAHGDIRLSLDLFRSFSLSGYTNVDDMLSSGSWNFQIHQVIKPVMTPTRFFYDESLSDIPNIYQIRTPRSGSHFTGLRILRKLSKGVDVSSAPYFAAAQLRSYFAETFGMLEDFEQNMNILLKYGFVESDNRLDIYSEAVNAIKITSYGAYLLKELASYFPYLDLVCTDCGVFDESASNYLAEAARKEYGMFMRRERIIRVDLRLDRAKFFIDYLKAEEYREKELYGLTMPENEMFWFKNSKNFESEKVRVRKSARRQKLDAGDVAEKIGDV